MFKKFVMNHLEKEVAYNEALCLGGMVELSSISALASHTEQDIKENAQGFKIENGMVGRV